MEESGANGFDGISSSFKRKRSQTSRRPRLDSPPSSSSTPPSDDVSKVSSDETNYKRKEIRLDQCMPSVSPPCDDEGENFHKSSKGDRTFSSLYNNGSGRSNNDSKRCSEGVLAPANWKGTRKEAVHDGRNGDTLSSGQIESSVDGLGHDNKVKKMKLKVCGVTRTIEANPTSVKSSGSSDATRQRQKQSVLGTSDDNHSPSDKKGRLQGIPWKDFKSIGFDLRKEEPLNGKMSKRNYSIRSGDKSETVSKSKKDVKKRANDGDFSDEDEDDEIRYLEKLKVSKAKAGGYKEDDERSSKKHRKLSSISDMENVGVSKSGKASKKTRSDRVIEQSGYEEEEEDDDKSAFNDDLEVKNKKKQRIESTDSVMESKRETTLTTRQRALQSSKDSSSVIEFPNGLPPAPPRKQKEKLSEIEQQVKKAEAAQRRRMQVEKAAKESEAEAIRKILNQDSNRKKKEDQIKKRQQEMAQEKAANAQRLAPHTVRWVMGPTGTTVTFPNEMGLPSIFNDKPPSYPPPREKCSGPSCSNPYKYRDSKSKLPLCSLECYQAVQGVLEETSC